MDQPHASGGEIPISDVRPKTTPSPVVETPRRSSTPNTCSLAVMESSQLVAPQYHLPLARGAVASTSIASFDLQTFVEPLPLEQLLFYTPAPCRCSVRQRYADGSGDLSPVARWHPVGPARHAEGLNMDYMNLSFVGPGKG